jgi:hypothetical protein
MYNLLFSISLELMKMPGAEKKKLEALNSERKSMHAKKSQNIKGSETLNKMARSFL